MFDAIQPIDTSILFAIQGWHNAICDGIAIVLDFIADNGYLWIPVIVLMLLFRRTRKVGICMAISFLICLGGTALLKHIISRPRPCDLFTDVALLVTRPEMNTSLPSGHTILAFAPAFCLWFQNWKFGLPATIVACAIGFSRIYLFCHNPSDILISIVLAAIVVLIVMIFCRIFTGSWNSRQSKKRVGRHG